MYVTRPLSLYKRTPEALDEAPPEGPSIGYLVVADEEWVAEARCCFGLCKDARLKKLPFPQNNIISVGYTEQHGESSVTHSEKALFIPLLGKPLSSNQYYVIVADGKRKGNACTSSREEDMTACCFCNCIKDVKPRPFDQRDIYQQFQINHRRYNTFVTKSLAQDGFPPYLLRVKGWEAYISSSHKYQLTEANGVNESLRTKLPSSDFPISNNKFSTPTIVGKWYCPFIFIKEMASLQEQMSKSIFYELHLEQFWEEIFAKENYGNEGNVVVVDTSVRVDPMDIAHVENGWVWFRPIGQVSSGVDGVGLDSAIVERIKWEATRGGWVEGGGQREVKIERTEYYNGVGAWSKFGCYVLVERFVLKRIDGSLVLSFDFIHIDKIISKWEY